MKKIKLFPAPHMEVRIFVSDEMEKDFMECRRKTGKGKILRIPNCDECSWAELNVCDTCICMYESVQRQLGGISGETDRKER